MINAQNSQHARPYWHVDMKWICGILLFLSLSTCLLLYNLSGLTDRTQAVDMSSAIIANIFGQNSLSDLNVAQLKQLAALSSSDTIAPIDSFPNIHLTKEQILSLSPADLRLAIFGQLAGPIYDLGVKGAAAQLTSDQSAQNQLADQAAPLAILTKPTHDILQNFFVIAAIVSAVFAALLIFFSAGWGRLVSPAVVLLAISPLGAVVGLVLLNLPANANPLSSFLPARTITSLGNSFSHSYLMATIAGIGLLVIAGVGKIVASIIHHSHKAPIAKPSPATDPQN